MARGTLSENERQCLDGEAKNQSERLLETEKTLSGDCKPNGLRVRFLDEEGKTERTVSADEVDYSVSKVKKIHILKNRSSSETSILLRNPSLMKRYSSAERRFSDGNTDNLNNNSMSENLNGRISILKNSNSDTVDKTENDTDQTKDANGLSFKKNCNVYSVNQAKTLTPERKKSIPLTMPRLIGHKLQENGQCKSILPAEVCLADGASGKDFTSRAIGRLSRGLGKLLRRTNSVRISEPDPVYKVAYLGNVLTGWARGESCIEKPLSTLWRNYQQSTKPDVVMKLSVTNSGLKGFTKEHGLTEYWSHRITYCASPPHYPKLFCWVYRHEGKKLKHELRCHAVLCTKETISKKITEELQIKLKQALVEFKKDRISKQNARLSLANSVYDNPSMPRRKILLSVGATNYRPPLERSKSAPKLGAIEELCSEEDEEEAEMNAKQNIGTWRKTNENMILDEFYTSHTLDRRRPEMKSPRKLSCPEMGRTRTDSEDSSEATSEKLIDLLVEESNKVDIKHNDNETSQSDENLESRLHTLESIAESNELIDIARNNECKNLQLLSQSNFLVTDSDDGSVSSGCETASTVTSDTEPSSLPSNFPQEEIQKKQLENDDDIAVFDDIQRFERSPVRASSKSCSNSTHMINTDNNIPNMVSPEEVNHIPIGEKNTFRRRSTYPPLGVDSSILNNFEGSFEPLIDLTDVDSLTSSTETEVFKGTGDNDSACSDESGYSELIDNGKDSIIGNTIMV
ncbi:uncharacterized protein LOC131849782 [Achroia grisella]|uniref:uncharacterized protein LOC131849782 n=1 Tax=Achroia grisella TaxID=688607 RepID=UPI0027D2C4B2|nr:uncharacterized protein LOC131849782 [Achroia grisella]